MSFFDFLKFDNLLGLIGLVLVILALIAYGFGAVFGIALVIILFVLLLFRALGLRVHDVLRGAR